MGAAIKPRMMPALRTLSPTGTLNTEIIKGFMMTRPMKPQTTEGMAASSSTSTFNASRVFPVANSAM